MTKICRVRRLEVRITAFWLALAPALAVLAGCAGEDAEGAPTVGSTTSGSPELIGGDQAGPQQFRSTVGINNTCSAAKVGARLFLTAAHCVSIGRALPRMPLPEGFPPNAGLRDDYLPGKRLVTFWGLDASGPERAELTIVKTTMHPSWWACPTCQPPIVDGEAADIAVIEVVEPTPEIPEARVELGRIEYGTRVVKVGWGCEDRTNRDPETVNLGRYKIADASTIPVSEIRRFDTRITDKQVAMVDDAYLVTGGHDQDETNASLCLGDSGGPLYLADGADLRIVGVNADYTFKPTQSEAELGGVSWTDWHTRTSLESFHGIGQWLTALGVNTANTVGGS